MKHFTLLTLIIVARSYSAEDTPAPFVSCNTMSCQEALKFAKLLPTATQAKIVSYLVGNPVGKNSLRPEQIFQYTFDTETPVFSRIPRVAFNPNGNEIAFYDGHETMSVLDLEHYTRVRTYSRARKTSCLTYSRSEKDARLMAVIDRSLCFDAPPNTALQQSGLHFIKHVAINPINTTLAYASPYGDKIKICNYLNMQELFTLNHDGNIGDPTLDRLVFSNDGNTLACAGAFLKLWSLLAGKESCQLSHPSLFSFQCVTSLAFSPDDTLLASGSTNKTVKIWEIDNNNISASKAFRRLICPAAVTSIQFNATGTVLTAACDDGTINLFDPHTGNLLHTIQGDGKTTTSLAFHPTQQILAAASFSHPLRLWALVNAIPERSFHYFAECATLDQANLFYSLKKCMHKRYQLSKNRNPIKILRASDQAIMEEISIVHPSVHQAFEHLFYKS